MRVTVDNVWASPSTLHVRVIVWADDNAWRRKYECSVPVEDLEPDAVKCLWQGMVDDAWREDLSDIPLF